MGIGNGTNLLIGVVVYFFIGLCMAYFNRVRKKKKTDYYQASWSLEAEHDVFLVILVFAWWAYFILIAIEVVCKLIKYIINKTI